MRSGRKVAYVKLENPVKDIKPGQQSSFTIIKGFDSLWNKCMDNAALTIVGAMDQEFFMQIIAFPKKKEESGYLTINSIVPKPQSIPSYPNKPKQKGHSLTRWLESWFT